VIFGSSGGDRGSRGNTSAFTSRNSGVPTFTTLGAFIGAIPIRSGRGIGCCGRVGAVEEEEEEE
jgi:hypothetical protein